MFGTATTTKRPAWAEAPPQYAAFTKEGQRIFCVDSMGVAHSDADLTDPPQPFVNQALVTGVKGLITPDEQRRGRLLYPNGRLQHAGVIVGLGGLAGHWYIGQRQNTPGPMGRLQAKVITHRSDRRLHAHLSCLLPVRWKIR